MRLCKISVIVLKFTNQRYALSLFLITNSCSHSKHILIFHQILPGKPIYRGLPLRFHYDSNYYHKIYCSVMHLPNKFNWAFKGIASTPIYRWRAPCNLIIFFGFISVPHYSEALPLAATALVSTVGIAFMVNLGSYHCFNSPLIPIVSTPTSISSPHLTFLHSLFPPPPSSPNRLCMRGWCWPALQRRTLLSISHTPSAPQSLTDRLPFQKLKSIN